MRLPTDAADQPAWKDGDTMLMFSALVIVCGTLILWTALNPDNWQHVAADASQATSVAACPRD